MALTDSEIQAVVAELSDEALTTPYPGRWEYHPGDERVTIGVDPGLTTIVVDRADGTVRIVDADGESLVNSSPTALVACAREYTTALENSILSAADADWDAVGEALLERLRTIDPAAVEDENSMWSFAAEEVGYGM